MTGRCWCSPSSAARTATTPGCEKTMGLVVNELVEKQFASGKDAVARELVDQLAARYGDHEVVAARRQQLIARAEACLRQAQGAMENQQCRAAQDAVQMALSVWPDLADAQRLAVELSGAIRSSPSACESLTTVPIQWAWFRAGPRCDDRD